MKEASPTSGRAILAARVSERCEGCGAERPRGSGAFCRCAAPSWRNYCTRCVKSIEGELCAHCLAVATTNGSKLRARLDEQLARCGRLAGVAAVLERTKTRTESTLREFGIDAAAPEPPEWASRLSDKNCELPPGAEHSRRKMAAINELRLEEAGVKLALGRLGYAGKPTDEKLAKSLALAEDSMAVLQGWDDLSAGADHEQRLRTAADSLAASLATAGTLIETIRRRDLSALVEAVVRRSRAMRGCMSTLGIAP